MRLVPDIGANVHCAIANCSGNRRGSTVAPQQDFFHSSDALFESDLNLTKFEKETEDIFVLSSLLVSMGECCVAARCHTKRMPHKQFAFSLLGV